jgi:hypothetical protein
MMVAAKARSITRVIVRLMQAMRVCARTAQTVLALPRVVVVERPRPVPVASATRKIPLAISTYKVTAAAREAADTVLTSGCSVFLVEAPGFRPCYCIQDHGPDFRSATPA